MAVLVLVLVLHGPTPVISDDGSFLAQAALLRDGRTGVDLPLAAADPDGVFPPLENSTTAAGRAFPYSKHLVLPAAVAALTLLVGGAGGVVFSSLSVWLAGLAAMVLAARIDRRLSAVALWSTVLLTPLVFDANLVVATGTAAAALGFLVVAVVSVRARPVTRRLVPVAVLAFVVPMWRTEGMFAVAAVAVLATAEPLVIAARSRRLTGDTVLRVAAGVVAGTAGIAGYVLDVSMAARVVGSTTRIVPSTQDYDPIRGRLSSMWGSLLRPAHDVPASSGLLVALVAVLVLVAVVLVRRRGPAGRIVTLLVAAAAVSIAWVLTPPALVTGLLPAAPVLFAGLLLLGRADLDVPETRAGLSVSALTALGVVATSYSAGGGAEWGGRYFHILIPLLVPASLVGLSRARDLLSGRDGMVATVAVLVVAVAPSVVALRSVVQLRSGSERTVEVVLDGIDRAERAAEDEPGGPAGDGGDIVVVSARPTFGRFAWNRLDGLRLLSVADPTRLVDALDGVADTDVDRVVVLAQDDEEPLGDTMGDWTVVERELVGGWQITRMTRSGA